MDPKSAPGKLKYYWESLFLSCPSLLSTITIMDWLKAKLLPCKGWAQESIRNYFKLTDHILYPRHIMNPSDCCIPLQIMLFHLHWENLLSVKVALCRYHPNLTLCCELLSVNHLLSPRSNLYLNRCNDLFWGVGREAFI